MTSAYEISHAGHRKKMVNWLKGCKLSGGANVRDLVNAVASNCLGPHFEEQTKEYQLHLQKLPVGPKPNEVCIRTS